MVLCAMSGGVDSSVAAYLLKSAGHEIIGAIMKLFSDENLPENTGRACCTLNDAEDARAVANLLGVPFYVFNFSESFAANVTARFVNAYLAGQTPNPCIDCNRFLKFQRFLHRAAELECNFMATGHYARISREPGGRFLLKTGVDITKDQSYFLYAMTQNQLARTLFPLGEMKKEEVRAIAEARGFVNAKKRDSQDICFAPDGDYAGFIERHTNSPAKKGRFIDKNGNTLGEHKGIVNYTIGQRKGLGISAPAPLFVTAINAAENTVTLGAGNELFSKKLTAHDINLIPFDRLDGEMNIHAKIRYAHPPQPATVRQTGENELQVEFHEPQRAITPGQAIVLYDGDIVLGGGTIR